MPKFSVVVCPECKNAFIIEMGPKTVSCRKCNKRLETSKLRIMFSSDEFNEALNARGSILAGIAGDREAFDKLGELKSLDSDAIKNIGNNILNERFLEDRQKVDEMMKKEAGQTRKKGQQAILTDTFNELSEKGDVPIEEYWDKVSYHGITRLKFDRWIEKMIETGIAFSPRFGYLKRS
jgi:hypothetical protein